MIDIKICGLQDIAACNYCVSLAVDYLGFVAYSPSPRHIEPSTYHMLAHSIASTPCSSVLVTVNADNAFLDSYCQLHLPDYIQCHGAESPERLHSIRSHYGCRIIKALPVSNKADLDAVPLYQDVADILLLDAKPESYEMPGGNAKSFDWKLLQDENLPLPWILSGGLTASNVQDALYLAKPPAVDVSSGVEREKGIKDLSMIKEFIINVRKHA